MLPSVKINVPLLWGLCVLFFVESVTASTPETNMSITVKPNNTIRATTAAHAATERNEKAAVSNKADGSVTAVDGLVILKTTGISESLGSAAETTVKDEVQHSHVTAVPDSPSRTTEQVHPPPATSFTDRTAPANVSAATVAGTASELSSTDSVDTFTHRDLIQKLRNDTPSEPEGTARPTSEAALVHDATETKLSTSTEGSYAPQFISATSVHNSTSQSAETNPSSSLIPDPADTVASTSTEHPHTSSSSSTISVHNSTSQSAGTNPSSSLIPDPADTVASTSTELSHSSSSSSTISVHNSTSHILDLLRSSSTSADSSSSTATITTSPAGIWTSQAPRNLTVLTPLPTQAVTATPSEASKTSCIPVQPCSTWATVKQSLIVIASLAAIATIFMVSTIVLCVKLSERRYKLRKPQQETEMMCISALLPERNHTYRRQRNPITNGVMVFPLGGDSDEELGDNLTLSSFLPENV